MENKITVRDLINIGLFTAYTVKYFNNFKENK